MEKIKKSYVEKIYRGLLFSESVIDEVESRDPLLVEDDGSMQGFRFYDQEKILYAGRTFVGDNSNFSPWYFLGDRLSIEEVKELSKHNKGLNILVSNMEAKMFRGYHQVMKKLKKEKRLESLTDLDIRK